MLNALRFCAGSIARKELVVGLSHFLIENKTIRGFNGILALCAPFEVDFVARPKAEKLIKAVANCGDHIDIKMTPTGRLSIKSGPFRALIESIQQETCHVMPEGEKFELNGKALLEGFNAVLPFIGNDASRPWSNGVLLKGQSCFATNNVSLIEYWIGSGFPHTINVPRQAVKEMLRIDEVPLYGQMSDSSVTFHYSGDRWLRTQLSSTEWPNLEKILNVDSKQLPINKNIFEALAALKPFVDSLGRVYMQKDKLCTHNDTNEGTTYNCDAPEDGIYNVEILSLLNEAKTCDFTLYPLPCIFMGDKFRGALGGMKS